MNQALLLDLAGIAGIFVGFGALIIFTRTDHESERELLLLRGVATIGLIALVAALLPIALGGFGLEERALWVTSSLIQLAVIWFSLLHPSVRPVLINQLRVNPSAAAFFWIVLEMPIQVPLVLIIAGAFASHAAALYIAVLVLHLFESAQLLVQVVYLRVGKVQAVRRAD